jgi:hypothetical protein
MKVVVAIPCSHAVETLTRMYQVIVKWDITRSKAAHFLYTTPHFSHFPLLFLLPLRSRGMNRPGRLEPTNRIYEGEQ